MTKDEAKKLWARRLGPQLAGIEMTSDEIGSPKLTDAKNGALRPKPERAECLGENTFNQQSQRESTVNMSDNLKRADQVVRAVLDNGGKFIRSGDKVYILSGGKRILVIPDFNNHDYARIKIKFAG